MNQVDDKTPVVGPDSHLTLHYRVSLPASETEVISTFGARPATLQLGQGQLAEPLESLLLGLPESSQRVFELAPGKAYGERHPDMVQTFSRGVFDANVDAGTDGQFEPGDPVDFNGPNGERVAGVLKSLADDSVVVDFNHPLAGQAVVFEVQILGVL
jgi:FKBP-type peptidyl-prolyl cis-trans isomerase SlpA